MNRVMQNNRDVSVQYGTADLTVPAGFRNIIQLIGHQVLKFQPSGEIIHFIADYLQKLLEMRETTGYDPAIHGDMLERIQAHYHKIYSSELQMTTQPAPQTSTNDEDVEDEDTEYEEYEAALDDTAPSPETAIATEDDPMKEESMAEDTVTEVSTEEQPDIEVGVDAGEEQFGDSGEEEESMEDQVMEGQVMEDRVTEDQVTEDQVTD